MRTVGNWIAGRNAVPDSVWSALAKIHDRIHRYTEETLRVWREQGSPKLFDVAVPDWEWEGPALVAAWQVLDTLETEHVHVTLKHPVSSLLI